MNNKYTYLEVCAGCGGLSYGLELAGFKSVALIEIDKNCVNTLKKNFDDKNIILNDMRKIDFKKYKDKVDILVGGIPCQSFSMAGKREGLKNKDKGGLFYDFLRCIKEINPKMFMIENVEGLKNINNGETIEFIIEELEKLNFKVEYKVLNGVDFYVPQKRKRLLIIGTLCNITFEWPIERKNKLTLRHALKDVPQSKGIEYSDNKKKIMELIPQGGCWIDLPKDKQKEYLGKSFFSGGGKRGIARRLKWNEPSLTLTTSPCQKQTERCHPDETRPLKTREYARIQTFPDSFNFEGSISSIYKQIGNAVAPMFAFFVGFQLIKCLNKIKIELIKENILYNKINKNNMSNELKELFGFYYEKYILPIYQEDIISTDIDMIKRKIDISTYKLSDEEYQKILNYALKDSKITQQIGKLNEYIMASQKGWMYCKDYKDSKKPIPADIMKKNKSIFIELKNKHNTMNSGSRKSVINNLIEIKEQYPDALVVLGIVNCKNGNKNGYIKKIQNDKNLDIYEYGSKELSKLIYKNENLFEELEKCIEEYFKEDKTTKTKVILCNDSYEDVKEEKPKKVVKKINKK